MPSDNVTKEIAYQREGHTGNLFGFANLHCHIFT
jgi:hypothetical protein